MQVKPTRTQLVKILLIIAEQWDFAANHLKGQTCSYVLSTKELEALGSSLLSIPLLSCFGASFLCCCLCNFWRLACSLSFTQSLLIGPAVHCIAVLFLIPTSISRWGCHWGCHLWLCLGLYLARVNNSRSVGCHFGHLFFATTFHKSLSLHSLGFTVGSPFAAKFASICSRPLH